jgi:hypothetical protein
MINVIRNYIRKDEQYSLRIQTFNLIAEKLYNNPTSYDIRKNMINYLIDVIDSSNKRDIAVFLLLLESYIGGNKYDVEFLDYVRQLFN